MHQSLLFDFDCIYRQKVFEKKSLYEIHPKQQEQTPDRGDFL